MLYAGDKIEITEEMLNLFESKHPVPDALVRIGSEYMAKVACKESHEILTNYMKQLEIFFSTYIGEKRKKPTREDYELAALAAGIDGVYVFRAGGRNGSGLPYDREGIQLTGGSYWDAYTVNDDAFKLLHVLQRYHGPETLVQLLCADVAATKRAIFWLAVVTGKQLRGD